MVAVVPNCSRRRAPCASVMPRIAAPHADVCWFDLSRLMSQPYVLKQSVNSVRTKFQQIEHRIDVQSLQREAAPATEMNDIARVRLVQKPIAFGLYDDYRATGAVVVIDERTNRTIAPARSVNNRFSNRGTEADWVTPPATAVPVKFSGSCARGAGSPSIHEWPLTIDDNCAFASRPRPPHNPARSQYRGAVVGASPSP